MDARNIQDTPATVSEDASPIPDTGGRVPDARIERDTPAPVSEDASPIPDTGGRVPDAPTTNNPWMNHSFRIDTEHPAPTPDPTCTQNGPLDAFQFTFGSSTASMKGLMVSGSAAQPFTATAGPEANKLTYHIAGLLAGGIVTFEKDHDLWVAQATVYGSGVPVVRCLRGELLPQP